MTETPNLNADRILPEPLPGDLARALMALPAKQRLEAILEHPDSARVVAALPEQDFTLTVMELGPDDALPLLAAARLSQLNLLFDLQWWHKDEILPGPALEWIERLARASRQNLLRWLYQADFELLVSFFGRWLRVAVVADDAELTEVRDDYPPHTLDDQYFWEGRYPQHETLLRSILEFLFVNHHGFYKALLDQIMLLTNTEMVEEAFSLRNITETGPYMHNGFFPTLFEVVQFYNGGGGRSENKSPDIHALNLTGQEVGDLIEFMKALTGEMVQIKYHSTPLAFPKVPVGF